jgi:alpha-L-fucosidase
MNNRLYRIPEAGWTSMGTDGYRPLDPQVRRLHHPGAAHPRHRHAERGLGDLHDLNTTWGYSEHDHAWKKADTLIRNLADIASKGGNYLLNIGPKGDGTVPKESVDALRGVGAWMKVNQASIVGTSASPFPRPAWGRITAKTSRNSTTLYLHVFDWPADGKLTLEGVPNPVRNARLLAGGRVQAESKDGMLSVILSRPRTGSGGFRDCRPTFRSAHSLNRGLPRNRRSCSASWPWRTPRPQRSKP